MATAGNATAIGGNETQPGAEATSESVIEPGIATPDESNLPLLLPSSDVSALDQKSKNQQRQRSRLNNHNNRAGVPPPHP